MRYLSPCSHVFVCVRVRAPIVSETCLQAAYRDPLSIISRQPVTRTNDVANTESLRSSAHLSVLTGRKRLFVLPHSMLDTPLSVRTRRALPLYFA